MLFAPTMMSMMERLGGDGLGATMAISHQQRQGAQVAR